jgi:hypothetical protein
MIILHRTGVAHADGLAGMRGEVHLPSYATGLRYALVSGYGSCWMMSSSSARL